MKPKKENQNIEKGKLNHKKMKKKILLMKFWKTSKMLSSYTANLLQSVETLDTKSLVHFNY